MHPLPDHHEQGTDRIFQFLSSHHHITSQHGIIPVLCSHWGKNCYFHIPCLPSLHGSRKTSILRLLCWRSLMVSASKSKVSSSHLTLQRTEASIPPSFLRSQIHSFIFLFPCSILSWLMLPLTSSWVTVDATQSVILSLLHFHTRTSLYTEITCP